MSLYALATGPLVGDPVRRSGAKGDFATAQIRAATEDGAVFVSIIAFNAAADELLSRRAGEAIAVSGRAKLTAWTGRDGVEKHGISIVVEQIASMAASQRADRDRRSARTAEKSLFDGAVR
jgi:single-stranded DNA-binding protein